uniref:Uncharacterized protein n=1 Tax=Sphaerodactylus townsendi TaxID=933632 RepID=A0ACB8G9Q3_9SAUR
MGKICQSSLVPPEHFQKASGETGVLRPKLEEECSLINGEIGATKLYLSSSVGTAITQVKDVSRQCSDQQLLYGNRKHNMKYLNKKYLPVQGWGSEFPALFRPDSSSVPIIILLVYLNQQ